MAFRLVLLNDFFPEAQPQEKGMRSLLERPSLSALCGGKPQLNRSCALRFKLSLLLRKNQVNQSLFAIGRQPSFSY